MTAEIGRIIKRPVSLREEVYTAIHAQLMSHKIPPGGRIAVDSLVRELGVSQTPIREALSQLEAQGLVVKTHLIGYCAAHQLDKRRLDELYELRLLLEPVAARRAASNMDDSAIGALEALHQQMKGIKGTDVRRRYSEFAIADGNFHNLIACSGNSLIQEALFRLHTHAHLFRLFFHSTATGDAISEHEHILVAITGRDSRAAESAMQNHIEKSRNRFESYFSLDG